MNVRLPSFSGPALSGPTSLSSAIFGFALFGPAFLAPTLHLTIVRRTLFDTDNWRLITFCT